MKNNALRCYSFIYSFYLDETENFRFCFSFFDLLPLVASFHFGKGKMRNAEWFFFITTFVHFSFTVEVEVVGFALAQNSQDLQLWLFLSSVWFLLLDFSHDQFILQR